MRRRALLGLPAAAALAGCGFQLRRAPDFAFGTIAIAAPNASNIAQGLRRGLAANDSVRVAALPAVPVPEPSPPNPGVGAPDVVLEILQEQREKAVVGLNATGQVREFQLRTRLRFRVRTPAGVVLVPETELLQQRDMSFNEAAVLAKEQEEQLLYRDMEIDLVHQLMRRLAALQPA